MNQAVITSIILLFSFSSLLSGQTGRNQIECWPSEWWIGMQNNRLLLVIQGNNVAQSQAEINQPGIIIRNQYPAQNRTHLFLEIEISNNASPGIYPIRLSNRNQAVGVVNFTLNNRVTNFNPARLTGADAIYQIVPDRFVNAVPANDNINGYFERADRMNPAGIHGGDLQGIINSSNYLRQLGVTTIELTPVYETNQLVLSYERFSPTNHYKVDSRLGSINDLTNLVSHYRTRNIKVILTKVLHKAGNQSSLIQNLPASDWIYQRDNIHSGSDNPIVFADPYASREDIGRQTNRWESFDSPSLNHNNPEVRRYLIQNVLWWIQKTQPDGIKIEKTHLLHPLLLQELSQAITLDFPSLNLIASAETSSVVHNKYWKTGANGEFSFTHITDQPLYRNWMDVFAEYSRPNDMLFNIYKTKARDRAYSDAASQLIFAGDNHDLTRLFTLAEKDLSIFKMYAGFLFTTRGIPSFLYGSEVMMEGLAAQGTGFLRGDFPGGWPGDQVSAFNPNTLSNQQREALRYFTALLNWRKNNPDLMTGNTIHFEPRDNIYAYIRESEHKLLLVIINNHISSPKRIEPGRFSASIGNIGQVTNIATGEVSSGFGNIILNPKSILMLELVKNQ
ncbi:alpha-amylase family glycosyl hydrolase [Alkalitalea saponilacus]|uniref:Glycosidase n=1 Tax=Alkalitalea saponilacus TaxID=889453 RepID=A0A1T5EQR5_9BACT|nr:alpha-amylase family glycosyl hydrolase [Alkalitalea saponilacus]ASB48061.1 hypothetical protein CDL62_02325 [Alkalitalea saponilacus]SKB86030.1 Glycosidase [Alkalitalea saponilacus]